MDQIIDVTTDGLHLSRERGLFVVKKERHEIGRTPLDQISSVIVHAHGTTWSMSLLTELGRRGIPVVLCGPNHLPQSVLMPANAHHLQGGRIRNQWTAKKPLIKQIWKKIVLSKISMQAAALESVGCSSAPLRVMAKQVVSGDRTNVEAQAARYYWPKMMGEGFRRDRYQSDANSLLNYGYTILRSASCRAVMAVGLNPSIGIHHSNRGNSFALADDLMEPFRPLVDCTVKGLFESRSGVVDSHSKKELCGITALDLSVGGSVSPVSLALVGLARSVCYAFETSHIDLLLPEPPDKFFLSSLGRS